MSILGRDRPWTDEERSAALRAETFEEFSARYPDRTWNAWRIKRQRMADGKVPIRGDARNRSTLEELRGRGTAPDPARRPTPRHPSGWEPGVAWDGRTGSVTAASETPDPNWDSVLRHFGLDPEQFEVVEPVQMRTWDAAVGNGEVRQMWYYRANIRSRTSADDRVDVSSLIEEIGRHGPSLTPTGGPRAFVVVPSDWQIGKKGTRAAVERVQDAIDAVQARYAELRAVGREFGALYVLAPGDTVEGCTGFYPMQEFEVELNARDQRKVARRLFVAALARWAPEFERVVVAAVGGNHGENRKDSKAYTSFGDNADVEVVEQVAEIMAANPAAYGHVSFAIPDDQLTLTLDVAGTIIGLAHGHQARSGPTPAAKAMNFWKGQGHGMRPIGDAAILQLGHFHHLIVEQDGPRTLFIAPTLDSGSQWWEETVGSTTRPGTLTYTVGPTGWADLQVV